jgi:hypothetical protein
MIYAHMADPTSTYFSNYLSLYLSYCQIEAEIKEQCGPVLETHLFLFGGLSTAAFSRQIHRSSDSKTLAS